MLGLRSGLKLLRLPKLSPSMESAKILQWHVFPGHPAKEYDLCATLDVSHLSNNEASSTKMQLELHEEMFVAHLFNVKGRWITTGEPLLLLCDTYQMFDEVSKHVFNILV